MARSRSTPSTNSGTTQRRARIRFDGLASWARIAALGVLCGSAFSGVASSNWPTIGAGTPGTHGIPSLSGEGPLTPRSENRMEIQSAQPNSIAVVFTSLSRQPIPFFGGELLAFPIVSEPLLLPLDGTGRASVRFVMGVGIRPGTHFYIQAAIADTGTPFGVALTNGVLVLAM